MKFIKAREILDSLLERIDWKIFVKAYFDRDGLLQLAKELKGKFNNLMPSELNNLMKNNNSDYSPAKERLT